MRHAQRIELRLDGITHRYPGVVALQDVSLDVTGGEVVGLIGENGAGKSTLMKVLGGIIAPSAGAITIDGTKCDRLTVAQSQAAGVAFVHQELNVFDNLDVAGNIFLGREPRRGRLRLLDRRTMHTRAEPLLRRVGARFDPATPVAELSLASRQLLEIAKALSQEARLIILDEPTSSLTLAETGKLLGVVKDLKAHGIGVVYISHRLGEIASCADRVVGLRDGRVAGSLDRAAISHEAMIRLMIGRDLKSWYTPPASPPATPVLKVEGARTAAFPDQEADLEIRSGEIVGVAGLVGSGRSELARAIFGVDPLLGGQVTVDGKSLPGRSPSAAIAAGLYLVPEDRKLSGLILGLGTTGNVTLANLAAFSRRGLLSKSRQHAVAASQRVLLGIKVGDLDRPVSELSGGNQQKVVLGKWLSMRPRVIIFDEPTRGIDVGAKVEIYALMRGLADAGVGILMISSDMEEVTGVSDRLVVMRAGAIAGGLDRPDFSEQAIMRMAVGSMGEEK